MAPECMTGRKQFSPVSLDVKPTRNYRQSSQDQAELQSRWKRDWSIVMGDFAKQSKRQAEKAIMQAGHDDNVDVLNPRSRPQNFYEPTEMALPRLNKNCLPFNHYVARKELPKKSIYYKDWDSQKNPYDVNKVN